MSDETIDTAPIARLTIGGKYCPTATLYAPGLPPGEYDVYPVPVSAAAELDALRTENARIREENLRLRDGLLQIRNLGHSSHHGRGYTLATLAQEALDG